MFIEFKPVRPAALDHANLSSETAKLHSERAYQVYCERFYERLGTGLYTIYEASNIAETVALSAMIWNMDLAFVREVRK